MITNFISTIKTLAEISIFKSKPYNLAFTWSNLGFITILYTLMMFKMSGVHGKSLIGFSLFSAISSMIVGYGILYFTLKLSNKLNRLNQLFSSFFGIKLIFISLMYFTMSQKIADITLANILIIMLAWMIIVHANIFRYGFDISKLKGLFFAVIFNILTNLPAAIIYQPTLSKIAQN